MRRAVRILSICVLGAIDVGCPPPEDVEGGWVEILNQSGENINFVEIVYGGPVVAPFRENHDLENDKIAPNASRTFRLRYDGTYQVNTRQDVGGWDFNDLNTFVADGITVMLPIDGD